MAEETPALAVIAAAAAYFGHSLLHSGYWEQIPAVSGESTAVGVGLAVLALAGVYLNSLVYEGDL